MGCNSSFTQFTRVSDLLHMMHVFFCRPLQKLNLINGCLQNKQRPRRRASASWSRTITRNNIISYYRPGGGTWREGLTPRQPRILTYSAEAHDVGSRVCACVCRSACNSIKLCCFHRLRYSPAPSPPPPAPLFHQKPVTTEEGEEQRRRGGKKHGSSEIRTQVPFSASASYWFESRRAFGV